MDPGEASRTAVLVCQGRAVAQGRIAPGRFDDPTALELLRPDERTAVEAARSDVPPTRVGERMRYEALRASAEVIVPRTVAIDAAVLDQPTSQVVILGAGLDGRAWRLTGLAAADVFEVDHPTTQADLRDRVGALDVAARAVHFVPVDFARDSLDEALDAAGHDLTTPTTWIWEGVIPYLTPGEVEATLRSLTRRSPSGSRLVANYQSPSLPTTFGLLFARAAALVDRGNDPMRHEPRRSAWTPDAMRDLLAGHGWRVEADHDLLSLARALEMPVRNRRSLASGRVAVADR